MAAKKPPQKANKPTAKKTSSYKPTKAQAAAAQKRAEADMKKYGFKTVEELIAFYDKQRGY